MTIDLNADVGEREGEETVYTLVTSVNVACGGHAGDEASMSAAVGLAGSHGVCVGAHPGYADREQFGRRSIALAPGALMRSLAEQVHALSRVCRSAGVPLVHVKPHGALYHDASARAEVALAIAEAVAQVGSDLPLVGLAGSSALATWAGRGLRVLREGFADRAYEADGTLRARRHADALILDPARAAEQALLLARSGRIDTLCVHADTPGAATILVAVRQALTGAGIEVAAVGHASR